MGLGEIRRMPLFFFFNLRPKNFVNANSRQPFLKPHCKLTWHQTKSKAKEITAALRRA